MGAPYRIVNRYSEPLVTFPKTLSIKAAIEVCKQYRLLHPTQTINLHGDDYDEGCSDGLSRVEREILEEEGLEFV